MTAVTYSILTIAEAGDNIVSVGTLYGGTYNLFAHTIPQLGIHVRFADYRDPQIFKPLIDAKTKAIYCESIGKPLTEWSTLKLSLLHERNTRKVAACWDRNNQSARHF